MRARSTLVLKAVADVAATGAHASAAPGGRAERPARHRAARRRSVRTHAATICRSPVPTPPATRWPTQRASTRSPSTAPPRRPPPRRARPSSPAPTGMPRSPWTPRWSIPHLTSTFSLPAAPRRRSRSTVSPSGATCEYSITRWLTIPGLDAPLGPPLLPRGLISPAVHRGTAVNHAELRCQGTTITAQINSETLATVSDNTFASGRMWIAVGEAFGAQPTGQKPVARFGNLVVTAR